MIYINIMRVNNILIRIAFIFVAAIFCFAQNGNKISSEELLKLRNLQFEQAKRVVRMQDLRTEFERINGENEQLKIQIDAWIKEQAQKQNIDLTKYYFDSDQLKFVEIKKNEQKSTN